jgi:hypothetical protein
MELNTRAEQGEDVWDELQEKTNAFKSSVNGAVGYNTAYSEMVSERELDPTSFQDDEETWQQKQQIAASGLESAYDYADVTKTKELLINTAPQKKQELSDWYTPDKLSQFSWLTSPKKADDWAVTTMTVLPNGDKQYISKIDKEKAKDRVVQQLNSYVQDPDAIEGMISTHEFSIKGSAPSSTELSKLAGRFFNDDTYRENVLDSYAETLVDLAEVKMDAGRENVNMPSEKTKDEGGFVISDGDKTYRNKNFAVSTTTEMPSSEILVNKELDGKNQKLPTVVVSYIGGNQNEPDKNINFTDITSDEKENKTLPVSIKKIYKVAEGSYYATGLGYDYDVDGNYNENAKPRKQVEFFIDKGNKKDIETQFFGGAPIELLFGDTQQKESTEENLSQEEWNKKWSSLKSGESMIGLDGKTYTKK